MGGMKFRDGLCNPLSCCTIIVLNGFGEDENGAMATDNYDGYDWDEFVKELRKQSDEHDFKGHGYGSIKVNGLILATTTDNQPKAKKNLAKFGFECREFSSSKYPDHDGQLWIMDCSDFQKKLEEAEAGI